MWLSQGRQADNRSVVVNREWCSREGRTGGRQKKLPADIRSNGRTATHGNARRVNTAILTSVYTCPPREWPDRTSHNRPRTLAPDSLLVGPHRPWYEDEGPIVGRVDVSWHEWGRVLWDGYPHGLVPAKGWTMVWKLGVLLHRNVREDLGRADDRWDVNPYDNLPK